MASRRRPRQTAATRTRTCRNSRSVTGTTCTGDQKAASAMVLSTADSNAISGPARVAQQTPAGAQRASTTCSGLRSVTICPKRKDQAPRITRRAAQTRCPFLFHETVVDTPGILLNALFSCRQKCNPRNRIPTGQNIAKPFRVRTPFLFGHFDQLPRAPSAPPTAPPEPPAAHTGLHAAALAED